MRDQHFYYKTDPKAHTCCQSISFDVIDGRLFNVYFKGGCTGNTRGIMALSDGVEPEEAVRRCKGIDCHDGHSCPDEFAKAVELFLAQAE